MATIASVTNIELRTNAGMASLENRGKTIKATDIRVADNATRRTAFEKSSKRASCSTIMNIYCVKSVPKSLNILSVNSISVAPVNDAVTEIVITTAKNLTAY